MLSLRRIALALFVGPPVLIACSSGAGGGVGGDPIPKDQFGKKLVEKICGAIGNCCSQNGFAEEHKRCLQNADKYQAAFDAEFSKKPGLTYDAARAGNCLAKWSAALGTCTPKTSGFDPDDDPDCRNVYRGTKAPGSPCNDSAECAEGGLCYGRDSAGGTGTCVARKPTGAAGDPCLAGAVTPDPAKVYASCNGGDTGLYCDEPTGTCKAAGGAGTMCMSDGTSTPHSGGHCSADTYCDYGTKKCEPRPHAGESCAASGAICADGTYCEQQSKTCANKKPAGADCGAPGSGGGECQQICDSQTKKCLSNGIPRDLCAGEDFD